MSSGNTGDDLPDWAKATLGLLGLAGLYYVDKKLGGPEYRAEQARQQAEEKRRQIEKYIQQAEKEVEELILTDYNEAITILTDAIPMMSVEYWEFFEAKLDAVGTLKAKNLLAKARELARYHQKDMGDSYSSY